MRHIKEILTELFGDRPSIHERVRNTKRPGHIPPYPMPPPAPPKMENNSTTFRERLERTSPVMEPLKTQVGGDHYKGKAIQPVEFIHANNIDFMAGNAIKYLTRHREKGGAQDVRKALHYCQLILALEYGEKP